MNGKADKRRPLVVAIVLLAAIGTALVAPVMIGARRGEPIPGSVVRADSRETATITTPLTLFSSPSVVIEKGTVALVGLPAGESRVGAVLRALVMGGGADLVLDRARLVVDRRGSTAPASTNAAVSEDLGPVIASLSGFKFRTLTLLDTTVVIETGEGEPETISVHNVEIVPSGHGLVGAKGRLEVRGEPLDIDIAFARPSETAADTPIELRATVRGDHLTASFNGRLAPGEHWQITAENAELSVSDLRSFASWLGASWADGPGFGPFTAKGLLTLEGRRVSFEHATFTLDGNAASGALILKRGEIRPSIEGTLAFVSFDIAPYAAPSRPYALVLAADWISGIRVSGLAPSSVLRDMDADLRISAGSVTSGSERIGRGAASLSVKDGKLYGELAELELEQGGRGEGQFTVDMTGDEPHYTLRADLSDIGMATVVAPRLGPAVIDGAGDIRLDLSASGASEAEVMRSLSGKLSLTMEEGGRLGLDIEALPAAALATAPAEGWGAVGSGATAVSRLTASFTAANGVLAADTVEAAVEDRIVTAFGTVDLDNSALDLVLSIAPTLGAAKPMPAGKALGAFKLHGSWAAPAITRTGSGRAAGTAAASAADPG